MRETFHSLGSLLGYYRFLKLSVCGKKTLLPQKDFDIGFQFDAIASRSSLEEKLCFIGDVENFVKFYFKKQKGYVKIQVHWLYHIFHLKFCPESAHYKSYSHMAHHVYKRIARGENIPRQLKYRQNLWKIADRMNDETEDYFLTAGMIVEDEK